MNREKYLNMIEQTNFALHKEFVDTSIIVAICANIALYFFFKNIIATVLLAVVFVVSTIILIRNRWYLPEHYNSLLVKSVLAGHLFIFSAVALVLFEIKMNIVFWFYIVEAVLAVVLIYCAYINYQKALKRTDYTIDFSKTPQKGTIAGISAYSLSSIFSFIPITENFTWHFLSTFFLGIVLLIEFMFLANIFVFGGYIKYVGD